MTSTLTIVTTLAAVLPFVAVLQARPTISRTSLGLAWTWALLAAIALPVVWVVTEVLHLTPSPWDDIAWYGVAILLLCPPIAVLGARRPGVTAWNWFVMVPLLAVLGWPALAVLIAGPRAGSFSLEGPPLIGLLLVLVMGVGNYAGTRFRMPAALLMAAVAVLALSLAPWTGWRLTPSWSRIQAVWELAIAAIAARLLPQRHPPAAQTLERVWRDFRDQFGIVWAHRIRDRINEQASQERWPVRLERRGFVSAAGEPVDHLDADTLQKAEHTFRWLLRRFANDEWLDARLRPPNPDRNSEPTQSATNG